MTVDYLEGDVNFLLIGNGYGDYKFCWSHYGVVIGKSVEFVASVLSLFFLEVVVVDVEDDVLVESEAD